MIKISNMMKQNMTIKKITVIFLFFVFSINIFTEDDNTIDDNLEGFMNPADVPYKISDFFGTYKIIKILPFEDDNISYDKIVKEFRKKYGKNGKIGIIGEKIILNKFFFEMQDSRWDGLPKYEFGRFGEYGSLAMEDKNKTNDERIYWVFCAFFHLPEKQLGYQKKKKLYALTVNRFMGFTIIDKETLITNVPFECWILKKMK